MEKYDCVFKCFPDDFTAPLFEALSQMLKNPDDPTPKIVQAASTAKLTCMLVDDLETMKEIYGFLVIGIALKPELLLDYLNALQKMAELKKFKQ